MSLTPSQNAKYSPVRNVLNINALFFSFMKFEYNILSEIWRQFNKTSENYDAWFKYIQRAHSVVIFIFIKQLKENSDKKINGIWNKSDKEQSYNQLKVFWHWEANVKNFSDCTKSSNPSKRNKNNEQALELF